MILLLQPFIVTSTSQASKENVGSRTLGRGNQFLKGQLEQAKCSKDSQITQTAKLVKSFQDEEKEAILKKAKIATPEITAEQMVAMKIDIGIPWEKLKNFHGQLKIQNQVEQI